LALVALHESEDNWVSSSIREAVQLYFDKDIFKTSGLTLTEFFALPREYFSLVLQINTNSQANMVKNINSIQQNLGKN
jgi:hypothetical protein